MSDSGSSEPRQARRLGIRITGVLGVAEDLVYALTALILVVGSLYLLSAAALGLASSLLSGETGIQPVVALLDHLLVVLIFIELFFTVRLSVQERALAVEPFLAIGLIATVRRILVLTAQEQRLLEGDPELFQRVLLELVVLAGLVLVLVFAMLLLRRARATQPADER